MPGVNAGAKLSKTNRHKKCRRLICVTVKIRRKNTKHKIEQSESQDSAYFLNRFFGLLAHKYQVIHSPVEIFHTIHVKGAMACTKPLFLF